MLSRARPEPALRLWARDRLREGRRRAIPEIADYKVRRVLILARLQTSLNSLNALQVTLDYPSITTSVLRRAAALWVDARQKGITTADRHALDGDVILAATAQLLGEDGHDVVIATTNVGHLGRFVSARRWQDIG